MWLKAYGAELIVACGYEVYDDAYGNEDEKRSDCNPHVAVDPILTLLVSETGSRPLRRSWG